MFRKKAVVLPALLALLAMALLANICLGSSGLAPGEILSAAFGGDRQSAAARIFWHVRLPRTLSALMSGAALALSGLILQSVLRNSLASPGVIGVNAGAGLCALVCMAVFPGLTPFVPAAAFLGACGAAMAVYLLARRTGASRTTIVLAGVAVSSIFGAVMDAIVTLIPEAVAGRSAFAIGGFATTTMAQLAFAAPLCALGALLALALRREMGLLALGDDVAQSLGVRVGRCRAALIVAAAMLAGSAVSVAGLLGFVGLIAPHMARFLCKNDASLQFPVAALLGALLCLLCDLLARTLFMPYELPVGIVLSLLGAPFFLYLLLTRKRRSRHDGN